MDDVAVVGWIHKEIDNGVVEDRKIQRPTLSQCKVARGLPPKASQCRIASWPDLSGLSLLNNWSS